MPTRRFFLRNSALAMVGVGSAPVWLERALCADTPGARKKILVAIFQRGAADGLNVVVPHGEQAYYRLRSTIAIPRPTTDPAKQADAAIDLDGFFGLHPSLAPLKPLYDQSHLAIVDAAGSPDPTRSHFDAQDYMESGTPGLKATQDGWMNRALPPAQGKVSPVRAIALGQTLPRSMRGLQPAIALQSIDSFQVRNADAAKQFEMMYSASKDRVMQATGKETFEAMSICRPFSARVTRRPSAPIIRADASARASSRSRSSSRATSASKWPSPISAAGTITPTSSPHAPAKANFPTCFANLAARSPPSGRTWAIACKTSSSSP
jgi:uncharacterized protein (DUF1501 family)